MAATSRGIDVSSYQGKQDWKALAAGGLTFAQVKASEGEHSHDDHYRMHMDGILAVPSLLPQAYHYGWPTQDAHVEADNYLSAVSEDADRHPAFVHWLDLERRTDGANYAGRTSNQIRAWAEAWIDRVKAAHPRQRVGCYTSGDDIKTGRYPRNADALWYPAYPAGAMTYTQAEQRSRPAPHGVEALLWQFTSTPVDRSICYMTPAALRTWAGATVQEDDMPLTPADIKAVAAEVVKELTAPDARDLLAVGPLYWISHALSGDPLPSGKDAPPAATQAAALRKAVAAHSTGGVQMSDAQTGAVASALAGDTKFVSALAAALGKDVAARMQS
jgi:GH25 family lysozyme M1 (1,4-beta-N-acetylmuramidase)